jgi:predicted nucleic acid-binding protein
MVRDGMKPSVYLETTIPSYYTARPNRDVVIAGHQATTRAWWDTRLSSFRAFISQIVIDEASAGDSEAAQDRLEAVKSFPLLDIRDDAIDLARDLIQSGPLPRKAAQDALHIAIAASHGIDFLLTWNCKHIANAEMTDRNTEICRSHGIKCPVICTPEELMGT